MVYFLFFIQAMCTMPLIDLLGFFQLHSCYGALRWSTGARFDSGKSLWSLRVPPVPLWGFSGYSGFQKQRGETGIVLKQNGYFLVHPSIFYSAL